MNDASFQLQDATMQQRLREIHDSWSPADRERRAEEGRQRREELVRLILQGRGLILDTSTTSEVTTHRHSPRIGKRVAKQPKHDTSRLGA